MLILKNLQKQYSILSLPIKLFSLLILSTIVVSLAAWILNWKFGLYFYPQGNKSIIFSDLLNPSQDGGYFEHIQYILFLWCAILSAIWIVGRKCFSLIYFPFIYLYLLLDDALLIHDGLVGISLAEFLAGKDLFENSFIRIYDIAEWSYWIILFIIILLISIPSFQIKNIHIKEFIKYNYSFLIGLAFFGMFIDLIAANWESWILVESKIKRSLIWFFLLLLEEVGEIGVISFACIWLFSKNFSVSKKNI